MITNRRGRPLSHLVVGSVVMIALVAALTSAGMLSLAQARQTVTSAQEQPTASAVTAGPALADLFPTPPLPTLVIPDVPLPTPEPELTAADRCDDPDWWNSRTTGDPSDYVAACGTWPSWIDRGDALCRPGEQDCDTALEPHGSGAAPYTGPTEGRAWSPEYGYYEGRTDGPTNSNGEPCMQGRDNNDPNC
ncbi:hypothetical protein [Pseudonocardia alni]|uniref:Uncharacterized protein n=1 Tax=Pseudonocardia alni TaxID=33907 RepID=A0A852VWN0_PSEA5|nr:hypothetical protein [Pseudonocardia antarctica]NYG00847.1 hypothetical protein [Pseudonocardia antarctica]